MRHGIDLVRRNILVVQRDRRGRRPSASATARVATFYAGRAPPAREPREVHMSAADEYPPAYRPVATGWVGWVVFAAVFMMVIGAMNVIQDLPRCSATRPTGSRSADRW